MSFSVNKDLYLDKEGEEMKKFYLSVAVFITAGILVLGGCGQKKAENSQEAIRNASSMGTDRKKTDYLVAQAQAFYSAENYKAAVETARYVLTELDKDNAAARKILDVAGPRLSAEAKKAAENMKKSFGM